MSVASLGGNNDSNIGLFSTYASTLLFPWIDHDAWRRVGVGELLEAMRRRSTRKWYQGRSDDGSIFVQYLLTDC